MSLPSHPSPPLFCLFILETYDTIPLPNLGAMAQQIPDTEDNIVFRCKHQDTAERFKFELWHERQTIAALVRHHLRLRPDDTCTVLPRETWIRGNFNICVLVDINAGGLTKKFIFRCPIPYVGQQFPRTIDEKVSCEVATYIWMQEHCPNIRIPDLFAFGFTDGSYVSISSSLLSVTFILILTSRFNTVYTRPADINLHHPLAQGLEMDTSVSTLSNSLRLYP